MLHIIVLWISPLLLEILLFVWVTCRWSRLAVDFAVVRYHSLTVSSGALIRNRMGNLVYVFYSLRINLMNFHEYVVGLFLWGILWTWYWDIWRGFYDEACVPRLLCYSAAKFWIITMTILWRNKLLFIHNWDFWEMWHSVMWLLWFI